MDEPTSNTTTQDAASPENGQTSLQLELNALTAKLIEAETKSRENLDGWQRSRAEFSNYKKRQEADLANLRTFATSSLLAKLLPVLDDFERAGKTLPDGLKGTTWIEGMLLIQRKFGLVLESEGVKLIEVKPGDMFDPTHHEAISHDDKDGIESGRVIEELQKGYKLSERVLRPALVRVAK